MVERIVLFKLKRDFATEQARAQVAAHSQRVLSALPGVRSVSVGIPADEPARAAWDLSLVVRFASAADIPAYREHPEHRAYVDNFMMPKTEVVKAWNFEVCEPMA